MTMHPVQMRGLIPEWTFADRLRKARLTSDLTQEEFAERLGAKAGAYSHWEAGRNTPRQVVTIAQRIEMLTGIPAAWMLGLDDGGPGSSKKAGEVSNPRLSDYMAHGSEDVDNVVSLWPGCSPTPVDDREFDLVAA